MEIMWNFMEEGIMVGWISQDKWIVSLGSFLAEELSLKSLTSCKARLKWGFVARKTSL